MAPKRPRDNDPEDVKHERDLKRRRLLAQRVRKTKATVEPEKPAVAIRTAKRLREESDSDSECASKERTFLKRFKIVSGTSKVAAEYMQEDQIKNTRNVFLPIAINTSKVKTLVKHHVKRYSRFNPTKASQKPAQSLETPAINLGEVESMCLKAMKEKEEQLKKEYEAVLGSRMVEMYESFVKFSSDAMSLGSGTVFCSYLS